MSSSKFIVEDVFEIIGRDVVVLTGNILVGEVSDSMFLLCDDGGLPIKISSVEGVNDGNASIGLIFQPENELDRSKLMGMGNGNVLVFVIES